MRLDLTRRFTLITITVAAAAVWLGGCPAGDQAADDGGDLTPIVVARVAPVGQAGLTGSSGPGGPMGPQGGEGLPGGIGAAGERGDPGIGAALTADAGGAKSVWVGQDVILSARSTRLNPGAKLRFDELQFAWSQTDTTGVAVDLVNADQIEARFTVPIVDQLRLLEFTLNVTTPVGELYTDRVLVLVRPVTVGDVTLLGSSVETTPTSADVIISVVPYDPRGQVVLNGLVADQFALENCTVSSEPGGAALPAGATVSGIEVVEGQPAITAVLDFDDTGSMNRNDPQAIGRRAGGEAFFSLMTEQDQACFLRFSTAVPRSPGMDASELLVDWTNDSVTLIQALDQFDSAGNTPLWLSAAHDACGLKMNKRPESALVLLTDGLDNSSQGVTSNDLIACVGQLGERPVFVVGLGRELNFAELQNVARRTGGAFHEAGVPADPVAMEQFFGGVFDALRRGRIRISASVTYDTLPAGTYRLDGDLVVDTGRRVVTPFSTTFVVQ